MQIRSQGDSMKTLICHCRQCRETKKHTKKRNRIQTYQVRAARHRVRQMLNSLPFDTIDDLLPKKVIVDYYA